MEPGLRPSRGHGPPAILDQRLLSPSITRASWRKALWVEALRATAAESPPDPGAMSLTVTILEGVKQVRGRPLSATGLDRGRARRSGKERHCSVIEHRGRSSFHPL